MRPIPAAYAVAQSVSVPTGAVEVNVTEVSKGTRDQVPPASVERSTLPRSPTATAPDAPRKLTESRFEVVGLCATLHVAPPSGLRIIVPLSPTAQPWLGSRNCTSRSDCEVPLGR